MICGDSGLDPGFCKLFVGRKRHLTREGSKAQGLGISILDVFAFVNARLPTGQPNGTIWQYENVD
jgi:hypothetical protein